MDNANVGKSQRIRAFVDEVTADIPDGMSAVFAFNNKVLRRNIYGQGEW